MHRVRHEKCRGEATSAEHSVTLSASMSWATCTSTGGVPSCSSRCSPNGTSGRRSRSLPTRPSPSGARPSATRGWPVPSSIGSSSGPRSSRPARPPTASAPCSRSERRHRQQPDHRPDRGSLNRSEAEPVLMITVGPNGLSFPHRRGTQRGPPRAQRDGGRSHPGGQAQLLAEVPAAPDTAFSSALPCRRWSQRTCPPAVGAPAPVH